MRSEVIVCNKFYTKQLTFTQVKRVVKFIAKQFVPIFSVKEKTHARLTKYTPVLELCMLLSKVKFLI